MQMVTVQWVQIPVLGLGTFQLVGDVARRMAAYALDIGYRHIDTAQMYGNEAEIGEAIECSPVPRDQIFLATKVWPDQFRDGVLQRSVEISVQKLRTEPDLLLLHWPNPAVPLAETMAALNDVKRRGMTKHIGISNCPTALIERSLELTEEPLLVNQVEYHPYLDQRAVLTTLRAHHMALTAYSPIAQGRVFGDATLQRVGNVHGKTPGQVALRWLIQQDGVLAIPRSSKEANARTNFEIFDFELSADEMAAIGALARPDGRMVNPASLAPDWDRSEPTRDVFE